MPTPLDKAMQSKNLFLGFAGIVTAVAAWSIWGPSDIIPQASDPKGDPQDWTEAELRRWLKSRNFMAGTTDTRAELIAMVKSNMHAPK